MQEIALSSVGAQHVVPLQNIQKFHRRSIRIKGWDYSDNGWYFVTINTDKEKYLLGKVENGKMVLSEIGKTAEKFFKEIPNHFKNVDLDVFQVMPNHVHGIIVINRPRNSLPASVGVSHEEIEKPLFVGAQHVVPLQSKFQHVIPNSISVIVRSFKAVVTSWCNQNNHKYFQWQRNYWEHVIRNETELYYLQTYIVNNPLKWHLDKNNFESTVSMKKRGEW